MVYVVAVDVSNDKCCQRFYKCDKSDATCEKKLVIIGLIFSLDHVL